MKRQVIFIMFRKNNIHIWRHDWPFCTQSLARHLYKSKSRKLPVFFGSYINYKRFVSVSMVNSFEKKKTKPKQCKEFFTWTKNIHWSIDVSTNRLRERRADKRLSPAEKMGKKRQIPNLTHFFLFSSTPCSIMSSSSNTEIDSFKNDSRKILQALSHKSRRTPDLAMLSLFFPIIKAQNFKTWHWQKSFEI